MIYLYHERRVKMKKKRKLRPWVKAVLACVAFIIYYAIGILSGFVSTDNVGELLMFLGFYLLVEGEILFIVSL